MTQIRHGKASASIDSSGGRCLFTPPYRRLGQQSSLVRNCPDSRPSLILNLFRSEDRTRARTGTRLLSTVMPERSSELPSAAPKRKLAKELKILFCSPQSMTRTRTIKRAHKDGNISARSAPMRSAILSGSFLCGDPKNPVRWRTN
jgi:hypothetical protein